MDKPGPVKFSLKDNIAIVAILLVLVMTVLDVTVINVALPVLASEFDISDSTAVWLVTAYQLVITMLLLPLSAFGDRYSYRKCFLTGVVVFTMASLLCAASDSFAMIVASRSLQGVGAACVMGVNIALTRLIYPRKVLGRGLALNTMVIAIATAAGPTIAGCVLSAASWHWLFLINVPFGILAYFLGRKLLPQNPPKPHGGSYDWRSAIANMATFGLIFLSIGNFARRGDMAVNSLMLLAGVAIGIFYVRSQLKKESPMLPVDLFRIKLYSLSISTSVSSFIAQNVAMISLPFLFLNSYGFAEITTGLLMTPWPLATMIVSPLAARFVERHNPGATAAVGMAIYASGISLLLFAPAHVTEVDVAWRMAVCGIGFGVFQTPNNIVMVLTTPLHRTGGAGGMQSTARLVGQTLGATLVTIIFAILPQSGRAVTVSLSVALFFALTAGVFSLSRVRKVRESR